MMYLVTKNQVFQNISFEKYNFKSEIKFEIYKKYSLEGIK
jgi:hypothetical protein